MALVMDIARLKIITYRAIETAGALLVIINLLFNKYISIVVE
jgi:hypothetical protein